MIVASLQELAEQAQLTPAMRKGLDFLVQNQGKELPDGRAPIDGDQVYALVQSYETRTGEITFEGHRRYIDLQYVARGEELLGWAPLAAAEVTRPYNEERDIWLGSVPQDQMTAVHMTEGFVAVLYPSDAHAPMRAWGAPAPVKKIVVKVAL
jgi:YhcH/YjgK/YiaL family protein